MKVEIEFELTPEEARTLLGLPDLQPLHDIYLDRMKSFVEKGVTPEMMTDMVKSWSGFGTAGVGMITQLLGGMAGGLGSARKPETGSDDSDGDGKPGSRKR